ncbi:unannotated protein [freshwater metagenome]|uniref:Unannotated protein n=1 Tax=freshwater metagenome TaxID=449393 RepID=A0A6J6XTQ6_9ZZZZ
MSTTNTASPRSGAAATMLPSGSTTMLSPAPSNVSTGVLRAFDTISRGPSLTKYSTLFALMTHTLFSAARTGTCKLASSGAKEFKVLSRTRAPRTARLRGVSAITPSMQEYMPVKPKGVSTNGVISLPASKCKRSEPIKTCLLLCATNSPWGLNIMLVPVKRPFSRRTMPLIKIQTLCSRALAPTEVIHGPSKVMARSQAWSRSSYQET